MLTGSSVVDWMLVWSFAPSRDAASSLVNDLLQLAHIQPLKSAKQSDTKAQKEHFQDSATTFYRFVSIFSCWNVKLCHSQMFAVSLFQFIAIMYTLLK